MKGLVSALVTADVARAAEAIRTGGMVGLPTETVYGLAADAENAAAVARVFAVKGRPADHPLIVHVSGADQLDGWARDVPGYARRLAEALWPGPLTLVLPRSARAGDHVTGGQDTVGLRAPSHPLAQELLAAVGGGLAAPSANRFGRVSPTTAAHVLAELGRLLDPERDAILDGGLSMVGVESAILDCTGAAPVLLRPGAVDAAQVARVGGVPLGARTSGVRAPGTLASHYAPAARVLIATDGAEAARLLAPQDGLLAPQDGLLAPQDGLLAPQDGLLAPQDGLLALDDVATPDGVVRLSAPADATEYARVLYAAMREADALGLARVIAVPPAPVGIGLAVSDRLARAAATP
jgi:L-threonylcarbamoyladenylate synthase